MSVAAIVAKFLVTLVFGVSLLLLALKLTLYISQRLGFSVHRRSLLSSMWGLLLLSAVMLGTDVAAVLFTRSVLPTGQQYAPQINWYFRHQILCFVFWIMLRRWSVLSDPS